ncbi:MAG TPA: hypothetical protein VKA46_18475 [Gemmataceae bacterium]|nr:hypothetical protein [Gemmataceae bacterium]
MTLRLVVAILVLASALLAFPAALAQRHVVGGRDEAIDLPFGKDNWDMRELEQDPVKLVKVTAVKVRLSEGDRDVRFVKFVLEFQRDLTVRDTEWGGVRPQPPFLFRFQDENGVTLASETGSYDSVFVGLQGRRVQMVLPLPDSPVVRTVEGLSDPGRAGGSLTLVQVDLPVTLRTKKVVVDLKPSGS